MFKLFQILQFTFIVFFISSSDISAQQITDTSKVLVKFNEPMSRDGIFNTDNYVIYRNDTTPIAIYKVGIVPGDTAVVLFTEKHCPQSSYKIIINNLKDKSGNIISESHKMAFY
ncbi:MAG: hypothetical protein Q8M94_16700 [Ignavibacteria bacterium]|nr:hypothetical protein [Ignavibacteria bacterium]